MSIPTSRAWIIDRITLVFPNDRRINERLTETAQRAIREDMGSPYGADQYADDYRNRPHELGDVVGLAVRDAIFDLLAEWADAHSIDRDADPIFMLLLDLLDYSDRAQWAELGDHYVPHPDDMTWGEDETEDETETETDGPADDPAAHQHGEWSASAPIVTCGICGRSWCEQCDPAPSALCHWCHGRGYSTAPVR